MPLVFIVVTWPMSQCGTGDPCSDLPDHHTKEKSMVPLKCNVTLESLLIKGRGTCFAREYSLCEIGINTSKRNECHA